MQIKSSGCSERFQFPIRISGQMSLCKRRAFAGRKKRRNCRPPSVLECSRASSSVLERSRASSSVLVNLCNYSNFFSRISLSLTHVAQPETLAVLRATLIFKALGSLLEKGTIRRKNTCLQTLWLQVESNRVSVSGIVFFKFFNFF